MVYTVYGLTGGGLNEALVKENVGNLISNLFPLEFKLQQLLAHEPVSSVFVEKPIDTFTSAMINRVSSVFGSSGATAATTSAKPEAHTYTAYTEAYPAKLKSVMEIQGLQFAVSDTSRATSMYGIADRFAYEGLKATKAVAAMFEHSLTWSPGTVAAGEDLDSGGGTYYARQTQGLVHWICKSGLQRTKTGLGQASFLDGHDNQFGTNSPALNTGASSYAYDANGATLDRAMFKDMLMSKWYDISNVQDGARGFTCGRIKGLISEFALTANGAINERTTSAEGKRIVDTVDMYETEHGIVRIEILRELSISGQSLAVGYGASTDTVTIPFDEVLLFIKPEFFKIGVYRPISLAALGKTGDFESGLVRGEMGLICTNPQGGAAIVNCLP